MNSSDFNAVVGEQLEKINKVLLKKGDEYSLETDRLSAFKHASAFIGNTPEQALLGYLSKHIISVVEMIQSKKPYSKELWEEKMTDIHCYLILLHGLLQDTGRMIKSEENK